MTNLAFSIPGILPSSSPETVPIPSGLPAELTGGIDTGTNIFQVGLNLIFIVAIFIAVVTLILGGMAWITSGGDAQKVSAAKKRITFSLIGLAVVILSFVIVRVVVSLLGADPNTLNLR